MKSSQQLVRTIRLAVVTRRVLHRARYELPKAENHVAANVQGDRDAGKHEHLENDLWVEALVRSRVAQ
jgi:hypothetical protein